MGTQIGAVWNGKGFTFRDPRQLSLKQRLDVVKYVRSFERNPRKFLKVDLVGLRRKMNPARVRKDTPRYFFQSGETVFPEYDKNDGVALGRWAKNTQTNHSSDSTLKGARTIWFPVWTLSAGS